MRARSFALAASAVALLASCQGSPPPAQREVPKPDARSGEFNARRAWSHVEQLAVIGPRSVGSEGAARTREYLRGQLQKLGLEIQEQEVTVRIGDGEPFDLVNLAGRIPGESDDAIVIAAGYDTRPVESFRYLGVNEAASGPAVLLEMARVLSKDPLPYTTWFVFLDGEAPGEPGQPTAHLGSRALAKRLAGEGVLGQIRLLLVIGSVCDPDLHIARDLLSQRIYRREFARAAARLGQSSAFPGTADFESADAAHRAFSTAGLRGVVALVDTSFGGGEPPGVYAGTADDDLDHCSHESLGVVGSVSIEALGIIAARLAKIDRFAKSPVSEAQALAWDTLGESPVEDAPSTAEPTGESPGEEGSEAVGEPAQAESPEPRAPASPPAENPE